MQHIAAVCGKTSWILGIDSRARSCYERDVHELSVISSMLDEVEACARLENARYVTRVYLRVGSMSGIAPDALQFAWSTARDNTMAATAELVIDEIAATLDCPTCSSEQLATNGTLPLCAICGTVATVRRGRELHVYALDVRD
jgi:hydrogenase nickel incorporation protein HypA/HybF